MMRSVFLVCLCMLSLSKGVDSSALNYELQDQYLDPKLCRKQLRSLPDSIAGLKFVDSSAKIKLGLLRDGQRKHLGDYDYCLSIDDVIQGIELRGKYCHVTVNIPRDSIIDDEVDSTIEWPDNATMVEYNKYTKIGRDICGADSNSTRYPDPRNLITLKLGICIPRACSIEEAAHFILNEYQRDDIWHRILKYGFDISHLKYEDKKCRLPNDKNPHVADYIALVVFSSILIAVALSTAYDVYFDLYASEGKPNPYYKSFSVYSNTRKLINISFPPDNVECVDGIRALSMLWVALLHSFQHKVSNAKRSVFEIVFIATGVYATDTFFLLSGLFLVYTTVGKYDTRSEFIKSMPMFYLHRLMRLYPLMFSMILLQASLFNYLGDGPQWFHMAAYVEGCRTRWWEVATFVQNLLNFCENIGGPVEYCLPHGWYLAVDTQLYFVSPIILVWLFGRQRTAYFALSIGVIVTVSLAAFFSFYLNLPYAGYFTIDRMAAKPGFMRQLYTNPLARAAPFFIGMFLGYVLHIVTNKPRPFSKKLISLLWVSSLSVLAFALYVMVPTSEVNFGHQLVENLLNAYIRSVWSVALSAIIFACHTGYGGPINWFLSLQMWKLPSRLSYTMYTVHYPVIQLIIATQIEATTFTVTSEFHKYTAVVVISFVTAFILTVLVDVPAFNLQEIIFRPKRRKSMAASLNMDRDIAKINRIYNERIAKENAST